MESSYTSDLFFATGRVLKSECPLVFPQWYRHDYSREELTTWAERIMASGAKEVWVYFNNDRQGHAIKNALMLRRILRTELDQLSARAIAIS